ncbi:uncharacterized protein KQ657_002239 [Scheffersomyces spartinae]|uniref:Dolichol-phosphate mannosyltransferase subunit 3 n=1 Tax=Scheffersomyces spartinae TaxID=45513 RepID=A0A9P7VDI1_9ASCO|nr:uncharacterized protein KQ657_002239 [Scheffersomyces spartinae]KAG7195854.1 hypothetical protein KQ657_002239 [Scheffersomyces spartinae]
MTKATQTAVAIFFYSAVLVALYTGVLPSSTKIQQEIIPYVPFWSLVAFGAYALGTLGYDLVSFNDKPEKYRELLTQIDEAKAFYKVKGLDLD